MIFHFRWKVFYYFIAVRYCCQWGTYECWNIIIILRNIGVSIPELMLCSMQNFTCRTKKLIGKINFLLKYVRWISNYIFITVLYVFMKNYNTICVTTKLFHYQMDTIKLIDWMNWVNGITSELDKKFWIKNFLLLILLLFEDYTIEFCMEIYNFNLRSHFIYF